MNNGLSISRKKRRRREGVKGEWEEKKKEHEGVVGGGGGGSALQEVLEVEEVCLQAVCSALLHEGCFGLNETPC